MMFKHGDRVRVIHQARYRVGVVKRFDASIGRYVVNIIPTPYKEREEE